MTNLVQRVQGFWFKNMSGPFVLDGHKITRRAIHIHGGPSTDISCPTCRKMEWLSRLLQSNQHKEHGCASSDLEKARKRCEEQGDEMWTHHHQDFTYAIGREHGPRCLFFDPPKHNHGRYFVSRNCDHWAITRRRQMAQVGMTEYLASGHVDSNYDYALVCNAPGRLDFVRPDMPVIMYAHDLIRGQKFVDLLRPDYLLTPCPTEWSKLLEFPPNMEVVFYCQAPGMFFTRTNLGQKKFDFVVTGTVAGGQYAPRIRLNKQLATLPGRYKIGTINGWGTWSACHGGPTRTVKWNGVVESKPSYHYLNMYSEVLGMGKYVTFGPISGPRQLVLSKHYECLASGAVPIFPESPDFKYLGIEPFVHYIPFSEIEGDNSAVEHYIDNYHKYKHIAESAVAWHEENIDRMMFDDYEDFIHRVTGNKYPKRLVGG